LIDGASENRGLGHRFLRHIERCFLLALIIDMSGIDGRDPWDDYEQLLSELEAYDKALLEKPRLVIANKMDEDVSLENLEEFKKRHSVAVQPISCLTDEGIPELKDLFWEKVAEAKAGEQESDVEGSGNAIDDSEN